MAVNFIGMFCHQERTDRAPQVDRSRPGSLDDRPGKQPAEPDRPSLPERTRVHRLARPAAAARCRSLPLRQYRLTTTGFTEPSLILRPKATRLLSRSPNSVFSTDVIRALSLCHRTRGRQTGWRSRSVGVPSMASGASEWRDRAWTKNGSMRSFAGSPPAAPGVGHWRCSPGRPVSACVRQRPSAGAAKARPRCRSRLPILTSSTSKRSTKTSSTTS
jgi:hypothetical protein